MALGARSLAHLLSQCLLSILELSSLVVGLENVAPNVVQFLGHAPLNIVLQDAIATVLENRGKLFSCSHHAVVGLVEKK